MADIYNQCGPRVIDVSSSCDGSLTKADIQGMTPGTLESLKDTAIGEAFLYRQTTLAGISGVRENSLWDLLMSRIKNVGNEITESTMGPNKSFLLPYFMREQEDYINVNSLVISAGSTNPLAGTTVGGVVHRNDSWRLTVETPTYTSSELALTSPVKNVERYFLPGEYIIVLGKSGNDATTSYFKVVDSESAGSDKAYVIVEPNYSEGYLTGADLDPYKPTSGVVQLGVNSISDYESWCHNQPSELSRRMLAFWPQTSRFTRCWDDVYKEYLDQIFDGNINPYLERFKELPMAAQNRQQFATYQRKMLNSFFFGEAINENQTVETYRNLPEVRDPRGNNSFLEYKSNALGVRTQLNACGRVIDRSSAALNINELEEQLYILKRYREVDGGSVDSIDVMTDKATANRLKTLMASYYKARYGMGWERQLKPTEKIQFGQQTMWNYNSYEMDDAQVQLNVITEPFFADQKSHFTKAGIPGRGNCLMFVHWDDVQFGVAKVGSRKSDTPNIDTDPDLNCTIKANIKHTEMESVSWTPIINDPRKSLIWENFSDDCPIYTYEDCGVTS